MTWKKYLRELEYTYNPTDKHKASVDSEEENWDETNRVWLNIRSSSSTQKAAHF